jgi:MFS-type transporter involved in bile tolerance (Atg22 family)
VSGQTAASLVLSSSVKNLDSGRWAITQAVYNSLLIHVSDSSEQDLVNVSAIQCAIGNGGAMVLMSALGKPKATDA